MENLYCSCRLTRAALQQLFLKQRPEYFVRYVGMAVRSIPTLQFRDTICCRRPLNDVPCLRARATQVAALEAALAADGDVADPRSVAHPVLFRKPHARCSPPFPTPVADTHSQRDGMQMD